MRNLITKIQAIIEPLTFDNNVCYLSILVIISSFGTGIVSPVLPLFLQSKGVSFIGLGIIFSFGYLVSGIMQVCTGWLSDKVGRKSLIVLSYMLYAILLPLYLYLNYLLEFVALKMILSMAAALSAPVISALIGDLVPKNRRATVFSTLASFRDFLRVLGMFLSGLILIFGYSTIFFIFSSLVFTAALVMAIRFHETKSETIAAKKSSMRSLMIIFKNKSLFMLVLYSIFFSVATSVYPIYIPLLAIQLGTPKKLIGTVVAVSWLTFAGGEFLVGWISNKFHISYKKIIIPGMIFTALMNFALGFSPNLILMALFWALMGIGDGLSRPIVSALVVDVAPLSMKGFIFGTLGFFNYVGYFVGPLIYSIIAQAYQISLTFELAALFLIFAVVSIIFV